MSISKIKQQAKIGGKLTRVYDAWRVKEEQKDVSHWDGKLHPSVICGCPLAASYQVLQFRDKCATIPVGLLRIFDTGSAVHFWLQAHFMQAGIVEEQKDKDGNLTAEVELGYKPYDMVGSADGIIRPHIYGKVAVLEIKTINSNAWRTLKEPKPEHKLQGACYIIALREKYPEIDTVVFLYYAKDTAEIKEFPYKVTPQDEKRIEDNVTAIRKYLDMFKKGHVPAPHYDHSSKPPCRSCGWSRLCHSTFDREDFIKEIKDAYVANKKAKGKVLPKRKLPLPRKATG